MTSLPPLLALAQGRKVRPRKANIPTPLERELHKAIVKILHDHCLPDWKYFHPANGELRDIRTAARLKSLGVVKGIPDLVLISPHGSVRFLEFKRAGAPMTAEQEEFRVWCVRRGIPHVVATNIAQVLVALDTWRCLRIGLPKKSREE